LLGLGSATFLVSLPLFDYKATLLRGPRRRRGLGRVLLDPRTHFRSIEGHSLLHEWSGSGVGKDVEGGSSYR
jgi:hypothetical protein